MSLQKVISPHSFQKMFTEPSLCAKPFLGFEDTALRGKKKTLMELWSPEIFKYGWPLYNGMAQVLTPTQSKILVQPEFPKPNY